MLAGEGGGEGGRVAEPVRNGHIRPLERNNHCFGGVEVRDEGLRQSAVHMLPRCFRLGV